MGDDAWQYMGTRELASLLGLSPRTLDRYRVSGGGPKYHKFGNRVRYARDDIEAWAAERRFSSTSDAGSPVREDSVMGSLTVPRLKRYRQAMFTGSPEAAITNHLHGTSRA